MSELGLSVGCGTTDRICKSHLCEANLLVECRTVAARECYACQLLQGHYPSGDPNENLLVRALLNYCRIHPAYHVRRRFVPLNRLLQGSFFLTPSTCCVKSSLIVASSMLTCPSWTSFAGRSFSKIARASSSRSLESSHRGDSNRSAHCVECRSIASYLE